MLLITSATINQKVNKEYPNYKALIIGQTEFPPWEAHIVDFKKNYDIFYFHFTYITKLFVLA